MNSKRYKTKPNYWNYRLLKSEFLLSPLDAFILERLICFSGSQQKLHEVETNKKKEAKQTLSIEIIYLNLLPEYI